jgi:hypothetical protein
MPLPATKEIQPISDKEVRLATARKALTEREDAAYKYFAKTGQIEVAADKAEELFRLFQTGSTCEDIRRLFPSFSLGQIVACRVMLGWDERKLSESKNLQREVPLKVGNTALEVQDFLANLLSATHRKWNDALLVYRATGDVNVLKAAEVPLPKNMKELKDIAELFMKISGTDTKKVQVVHEGAVQHVMTKVSSEEAASIMADLMDDDVIDAEVVEQKQIEPVRTRAETVEFLVKGGMSREKAEEVASG